MSIIALYAVAVQAKTVYVAVDGSDSNSGTIETPFATIQHAQSQVSAGDTVYVRGGTYRMTESQIARYENIWATVTYLDKSGTEGNRINYWAYPGEEPIFDLQDIKPANFRIHAFAVTGSWIHIKGITVIGVHVKAGATGNIFEGCRAWFNSDDGYDCINTAEPVVFKNCWAMYNGYTSDFISHGDGNGFKVGGYAYIPAENLPNPIPRHTTTNCIAVRNKANGFYANHQVGGNNWYFNSAYRMAGTIICSADFQIRLRMFLDTTITYKAILLTVIIK